MNKEEKVKVVEDLKGQLSDYKSIYLTDIAGLDALQTSKLRRECFNSDIKLSVVKNTFLERAMSESENDFGELKGLLKGNTTIMLSQTGNSPAKVIKKFRKDGDKPILKGAFVDEAIYIGDEHIEALFNLKSKEEVLGEFTIVLKGIDNDSNNEIDKFDKIIILKIHPKLPIKIVPNIICLKLLLLETLMINVPIIGASASHHAQ